jgi:hypothetical protein
MDCFGNLSDSRCFCCHRNNKHESQTKNNKNGKTFYEKIARQWCAQTFLQFLLSWQPYQIQASDWMLLFFYYLLKGSRFVLFSRFVFIDYQSDICWLEPGTLSRMRNTWRTIKTVTWDINTDKFSVKNYATRNRRNKYTIYIF